MKLVPMKLIPILITVLFLIVPAFVLHAATIHVPSEQPTIQAGIDAAVSGDTVLVADGTYTGDGNRDIDFLGKAITVRSENGAEFCIIDCEATQDDPHRGFYFHTLEGPNSVLQGFTIRNGYAQPPINRGGGIKCENASPTITENIITECTSTGAGGGIFCGTASPVISRNTITFNFCRATAGGGHQLPVRSLAAHSGERHLRQHKRGGHRQRSHCEQRFHGDHPPQCDYRQPWCGHCRWRQGRANYPESHLGQ
jgi:hypothetical protein